MVVSQNMADSAGDGGVKAALAIAVIAAVAAISSAYIAARSAKATQRNEAVAQRIRDLEARIAEKKYDTYEPMINLLRRILDQERIPEDEFRERISGFATWVSIFGSDEIVQVFHKFMQAAYHDAPPVVLMKLYADFVISARRDMGYPNTRITQKEFLGMRIRDLYDGSLLDGVDRPLVDVCQSVGWSPPWPT